MPNYTVVTVRPSTGCRFHASIERMDELPEDKANVAFIIEGSPNLIDMTAWEESGALDKYVEEAGFFLEPSDEPVKIEIAQ